MSLIMNSDFFNNLNLEEYEKFIEEKEKEQEQKDIDRRIKRCIPKVLQEKTFNNFICNNPKQEKFLADMKKTADVIAQDKFLTVCLLGNYGIGKTHLSAAVMRQILSSKKNYEYTFMDLKGNERTERATVYFSAIYSLCDEIRERYEKARSFKEKETQAEVIGIYTDCDLLVIDEIGRSAQTQQDKEIIYKILNLRDQKKKSSILISNMSFQEFSKYVGGAVMDRLKNSAVFLDLAGMESQRRRK